MITNVCRQMHHVSSLPVPVLQFIYERGTDSYPSPTEAVRFQPPPLGLQPPTEIVTLANYRTRHAFYRCVLRCSGGQPAGSHKLVVPLHRRYCEHGV